MKAKQANGAHLVQVGDIFVDTWGYDQTNVDWYQVVSKTAKTITLRRIRAEVVETGFMTGRTVPQVDGFTNAEPVKKTPYVGGNGAVYVASKYGWNERWDGQACSCSWYA